MKTGERDVVLDETLEFLQALWALDHGLQTVSKRMKGELGVTGLQRLVLRILGRNPRLSAGELARALHLHPSTLTGVLERLQRQKLVQRKVDTGDRRRALFEVTPAGTALLARRAGTVEHAVSLLLSRETAGRIATVREVLDQLLVLLTRG